MPTKKFLEETFQNYLIWGLVSPIEIHRVAWNINNKFDFKLIREEDIIIPQKPKGDDLYFACFKYKNEVDLYNIILLQNQNQGAFFIKELKNIDYILLFEGETDFFSIEQFSRTINEIPTIQNAFKIPINQIKSKNILYIS